MLATATRNENVVAPISTLVSQSNPRLLLVQNATLARMILQYVEDALGPIKTKVEKVDAVEMAMPQLAVGLVKSWLCLCSVRRMLVLVRPWMLPDIPPQWCMSCAPS